LIIGGSWRVVESVVFSGSQSLQVINVRGRPEGSGDPLAHILLPDVLHNDWQLFLPLLPIVDDPDALDQISVLCIGRVPCE